MTASTTPSKTRTELKAFFKNGRMPDEHNFADLIDSMLHRDDVPATGPPAPAPAPPAPSPLPPSGWSRARGRLGSYQPSRGPDQMACAASLVHDSVPADGAWHVLMPAMSDCYGFEIVASASGRVGSHNHAVSRAVVLISFGVSQGAIVQTATYCGWDFRRKIRLKWVRRGDAFDLCIGTGTSFGKDDQGVPVQIQYHVTRIW